MKTITSKLAVAVAAAALMIGCGDDPDLSGFYETTYHTFNDMDCNVEGDAQTDIPYFRMEKDNFFGIDIFSFNGCTTIDDPECSEFPNVLTTLTEPIDNGWRGIVSTSSPFQGECSLSYTEGTAVLTDTGIRMETRRYAEIVTLPEAACTTDEAESRGKNMACGGYEVIEGTVVP